MNPTESQFPISHVRKLRNIEEDDLRGYSDGGEGTVRGGSYEVKGRGYNDKFEAMATMEIPGAKTQYNWGSGPARGTMAHSDSDAQDTFETPNAARQAAVNNASAEHVKNIKSGAMVNDPQTIKKGGVVKINSNPVKGK